MDINQAFPSKYIKSDDLQGQRIPLTIMAVNMVDIGDGEYKLGIKFFNKDKLFICNKTNAMMMASAWGNDTDAWAGKELELYAQPVNFQGRMVQGLTVAPKVAQPAAQDLTAAPVQQTSINSPDYAQPAAAPSGINAQQPNPATVKPGPHDYPGADIGLDDIPF